MSIVSFNLFIKSLLLLLQAEGAPEEGVVKDFAERVSCLLPPHWTMRVFEGCLYALQEVLQPFRVKRCAICYFFNGELSVEADGQRVAKSCEI